MLYRMLLVAAFVGLLQLDAQGQKTWTMEDAWLSYELPMDWRSDPFSSSSVCSCPGTINDNGTWAQDKYIGMVVYPVDNMDEQGDEKRSWVWDHEYMATAEPVNVTYNGITFAKTEGYFTNTKTDSKAWRLTTTENNKGKYKHYVIYFWSNPKQFDRYVDAFVAILESVSRQRAR